MAVTSSTTIGDVDSVWSVDHGERYVRVAVDVE
jgi:hypothetical protein